MSTENPAKSLAILKGGGNTLEVMFRYEDIPDFCYICGKLGHILNECDQTSEESDDEKRITYGEWLRASPHKPYSTKLEASRTHVHMPEGDQAQAALAPVEEARGVARKLQMDREVLSDQLTCVLNNIGL
ncbi:hypothetical protein Tsubulata_047334 [Turnera subulata]|uniref:CCHC-type domain-containing protein n=1 Tax=Turnera subulata TaxID=218843 RepID=A0A9Q0F6H5_9ROSI|nr:hypothetical protein Tsubulata_047334 [Turnera subulata]